MDIRGAHISFWYVPESEYVLEYLYCSDILKQNQEKLEEMKLFSKQKRDQNGWKKEMLFVKELCYENISNSTTQQVSYRTMEKREKENKSGKQKLRALTNRNI